MDTIFLCNISIIHACSVIKLCSLYLYLKQCHASPSAHARLLVIFLNNTYHVSELFGHPVEDLQPTNGSQGDQRFKNGGLYCSVIMSKIS
jgi:hypothetical protein